MSEKRLVWDLPLRLFHWLLVLSIGASWYTAENSEEYIEWGEDIYSYTQIHYWLGYWALGLILGINLLTSGIAFLTLSRLT